MFKPGKKKKGFDVFIVFLLIMFAFAAYEVVSDVHIYAKDEGYWINGSTASFINLSYNQKVNLTGDLNVLGTIINNMSYNMTLNPFNQPLNTYDNVSFNNLSIKGSTDSQFHLTSDDNACFIVKDVSGENKLQVACWSDIVLVRGDLSPFSAGESSLGSYQPWGDIDARNLDISGTIDNDMVYNFSLSTEDMYGYLFYNQTITGQEWITPAEILDVDYEDICSGDACPFAWNISGTNIYPQDLDWDVNVSNLTVSDTINNKMVMNFSLATYNMWNAIWSAVSGASPWQVGVNTIYNDTANVNFGLGLSNPEEKVHLKTTADTKLIIQAGDEDQDAHLMLTTGYQGNTYHKTAIVAEGRTSWSRANLHFILNIAGTTADYVLGTDTKMLINGLTGFVSIGNPAPPNPTHELNVVGTINTTNIIISGETDGDLTYLMGGGDASGKSSSAYLKGFNGQLYKADLGIPMPSAGSITKIGCTTTTTGALGSSWRFEVRKNGAAVFSCTVDTQTSGNKKCTSTQARGTDTFVVDDVITLYALEVAGTSTIDDMQCGVWGYFDD